MGGNEYPCSSVFLAGVSYMFKESDLNNIGKRDSIPAIIDWAVRNESCSGTKSKDIYVCKGKHTDCEDTQNPFGYRCRCSQGFEGNPYLEDGCRDKCKFKVCKERVIKCTSISAAIIFILLLIGSYIIYRFTRKRKLNKRKEMLFRQNGGHLLLNNLSEFKGVVNPIRVFTAEEMKKATDSFNDENIIGHGGFSIVYKGYLPELGALAIKKPKTMEQMQIEQFINEVVSKIHHQNVVTSLGCCLEMDVPLLVYEFVTNGMLHDHLHDENKKWVMPWGTRLKIAAETAGVLSFLHNNHRPPITHRGVKPANILLDGNYSTKVSDFGSSRLVPQNETHMYTMVQGTLGYLDPEYLHLSELTEKSDVYSFGVVLVELLMREKVVSFGRIDRERSLVKNFEFSVKDNSVYEIIDQHIVNEENFGEIMEEAEVANMCLRVKGEERPSKDEVAAQLKGPWMEVKHKWSAGESYNLEENEHLISRRRPEAHVASGTGNTLGSNSTAGMRIFSWFLSKGRLS